MVTDTEFSAFDTPSLPCDASALEYGRRRSSQYTLDDSPTGKKINFMITCKLAQMQMTNCIWGYSVTSLHVAQFDPVYETEKPSKWFAFLNKSPQRGRDGHCGNEVGTLRRDMESEI